MTEGRAVQLYNPDGEDIHIYCNRGYVKALYKHFYSKFEYLDVYKLAIL